MKGSITKNFVDDKGIENTITIEGSNKRLENGKHYKLQHEFPDKCKKKANKGILTSDIGIHSNGFAGVVGLATILAISALLAAYLFWKF